MREKLREWEKARSEMNVTKNWRNDCERSFFRSKDHRSIPFTRVERRKILSNKSLIDELKLLVCEDFDNVNAPTTRGQLNNNGNNNSSSSSSSNGNGGNSERNVPTTRVRSNSVGSATDHGNKNGDSSNAQGAGGGGGGGGNNTTNKLVKKAPSNKQISDGDEEVGPFRALVSSDTFINNIRLHKKGGSIQNPFPKIFKSNNKASSIPNPLTTIQEINEHNQEYDIQPQPDRFHPDDIDSEIIGSPHLYLQYESESILKDAYDILLHGLEYHPQFAYHDRELVRRRRKTYI